MRTALLVMLVVVGCRRDEPVATTPEPAPTPQAGWRDDDKLQESLAKLEKLKAQDSKKPREAPEGAPTRPVAAPPQPRAPRVTVVDEPAAPPARPAPPSDEGGETVYCEFKYNQQLQKSSEHITVIGAGTPMKDSYCTRGTVADATRRCQAQTRERFKEDIPCACTTDRSFIGSRCSP